MKSKFFAALVLSAATLPALATTWVEVARMDGSVMLYDADSVVRDEDSVKVLVKRVLSAPRQIAGKNFTEDTMLLVYHCSSHTALILKVQYFTDSTLVHEDEGSPATKLNGLWVPPDTPAQKVMDAVC